MNLTSLVLGVALLIALPAWSSAQRPGKPLIDREPVPRANPTSAPEASLAPETTPDSAGAAGAAAAGGAAASSGQAGTLGNAAGAGGAAGAAGAAGGAAGAAGGAAGAAAGAAGAAAGAAGAAAGQAGTLGNAAGAGGAAGAAAGAAGAAAGAAGAAAGQAGTLGTAAGAAAGQAGTLGNAAGAAANAGPPAEGQVRPDACYLEYERADNGWAAHGRPDGDLGKEYIVLAKGEVKGFVTDWANEKRRGNGTRYYGSHLRRATNQGIRMIELRVRTSPVTSQVETLRPGHSLSFRADLARAKCTP